MFGCGRSAASGTSRGGRQRCGTSDDVREGEPTRSRTEVARPVFVSIAWVSMRRPAEPRRVVLSRGRGGYVG